MIEDAESSVYARLCAASIGERVGTVVRAALSQRNPPAECPMYLASLNKALRQEPPPFAAEGYREIYHAAAADGRWLAISLVTNAEREGDGAKRLWSLAACSDDERERLLLKRHAVDEARHALRYLALLDLCFPDAVTPSFRLELNQLSPGYSMDQPLLAVEGSPYARAASIDDFLQMNIAEIRTTIHHVMQRAALAKHCPADNLPRMTTILDSLLHDELHHVGYTAVLIERRSEKSDPEQLSALFAKRLRDFNRITDEELDISPL
jgi:hypothetical protein